MEHWLDVIPSNIFTVDYENLVANQQQLTVDLLNYLELDWSEDCLEFHNNKRTVHTVSNVQIRKPIFSNSINSWHKYAELLKPYADKMYRAGLPINKV